VAVKRRCDQLRISSILLLEDGPKPFKGDPAAAQSAFFFKYLGVVNPDKKKKPADTPVKPDGSSKPRKKNGPDKVRT
jgi:hypothetical protein